MRVPGESLPVRVVGTSCRDFNEFAAAKTTWKTLLMCLAHVPGFPKRHWAYVRRDIDHPWQWCTSDGHYFPFESYAAKTYNPSERRVVK